MIDIIEVSLVLRIDHHSYESSGTLAPNSTSLSPFFGTNVVVEGRFEHSGSLCRYAVDPGVFPAFIGQKQSEFPDLASTCLLKDNSGIHGIAHNVMLSWLVSISTLEENAVY